jgi:hypothetical protein
MVPNQPIEDAVDDDTEKMTKRQTLSPVVIVLFTAAKTG